MTAAAGLYNVVRQIFGSVGIALAATEISAGTPRYHSILPEHVTPYSEATRLWLSPAAAGLAPVSSDSGAASARGQHLRELLDELGPTFVKFGQLLSTRPDVVPPDIIAELRGLQEAAAERRE